MKTKYRCLSSKIVEVLDANGTAETTAGIDRRRA
jgi:hypothetical protein